METLFTKPEVCQMLQISESTLNRMMKRREIQYRKISGRTRFSESDIDAYLKVVTVEIKPKTQVTRIPAQEEKRRPGRPPIKREPEYYPGMKVV